MSTSTLPIFNILEHTDRLEKIGETAQEHEFKCPVCGSENLKVNKKTGAYKNWSCECSTSLIREAIRPWAEVKGLSHKPIRPEARKSFYYNDRNGATLVKVDRVDKGNGKKNFYQSHWDGSQWISRLTPEIKGQVPIYRYTEVQQAISDGKRIFWVEGESCADALWDIGISATTTLGGCKGYKTYGNYSADLAGARLVLCPDQDKAGVAYMEKVFQDNSDSLWLYAFPESWGDNLPSKDGLDIADWLAAGATVEQIEAAIELKREIDIDKDRAAKGEKVAFGNFCQRAFRDLYTLHDPERPWVCVGGQLYQWQGTHYEPSSDEVEYRRIFKYADSFQEFSKKTGKPEYPFASPHHVEQAMKWIKMGLTVDPRQVNPPGVNCTNGILKIVWTGDRPSHELVKHSPEHIFTYAPVATYDPNANPEACNRMLAALEPGQQDVVLKVLAASLDLPNVRKFRGREVRGLLMKGDGANGKDTLRESLSSIYGYHSVTACSLSDFESYDQGRKFSLARLEDSRVNWASENGNATKLDKLQSLKAFITGDPLDCERKGVDAKEFTPKAIGCFNVNALPLLEGFQEAIKSRYAVVAFDKTFKIGADTSKGEIEADPRLKYDHEYLKAKVLPAFLNKLLDALERLMSEGIDYSCTESALNEIQRSSSHLFQFAEDTGLASGDGRDRLYAGEIWQRLKNWYLSNGTLTIETTDRGKEKLIWVEQARASDRNIKAPNQVVPRILQLFPKAKRGTEADPKGVYITGLSLKQLIQFEAKPDAVTQSEQDFEAVDPISSVSAQVENLIKGLSDQQRQELLRQLGVVQIGSTASNTDQQSNTGSGVESQLDQDAPETEATALPKLPHAIDRGKWREENDSFWAKHFPKPTNGISRRAQALSAKCELLKATSKSELEAIKARWGDWIKPIWNRVLTVAEQAQINQILEIGSD